jgi:hypothetical protein
LNSTLSAFFFVAISNGFRPLRLALSAFLTPVQHTRPAPPRFRQSAGQERVFAMFQPFPAQLAEQRHRAVYKAVILHFFCLLDS